MPRAYGPRMMTALLASASLALSTVPGAAPAAAQTPPSCPAGYYYASDGYCYPNQQPVYAAPPPVYDVAPPVYQPPAVIDGLAIGVGLGALVGALGAGRGGHGHGRPAPRGHR